MSLLRDDDEAWLVELHAQGAELVERYRELLEDEVPGHSLADALGEVVASRQDCLEQVAERLRARDALPRAGDPDRAWVQALADALGQDTPTLVERLVAAEARWRETLDVARERAVDDHWDDADSEVLERLSEHMEHSIERLRSAAG